MSFQELLFPLMNKADIYLVEKAVYGIELMKHRFSLALGHLKKCFQKYLNFLPEKTPMKGQIYRHFYDFHLFLLDF